MDKEDLNTSVHAERLATTDEQGHRVYIHPEDVKGKWRDRREIVYWFLLAIYFTLPWIHYGGKQIILLDLVNREFTLLGRTFFSHDGPLVFFIFFSFVLLFGFITAQWGRIWCGWACPQTVFIDMVYRRIEKLVEGKARQRRALDKSPMSLSKFFKKSLKWTLFLIVSLHLSHTFLGYFVGARKLFFITLSPPTEHMTLFIIMLVSTLILLFDFGWFREQFCIIACPYGRFQSVMMDEHSLVVAYDTKRGEPRRNTVPREDEGDCIDCHHCVKVCPTGIDIRKGTQLECINCTMCIDACDEIMEKVDKPKGLIRYDSLAEIEGKERKSIRPRPVLYALALIGTLIVFGFALNSRNQLKVQFIRGGQSAFQDIKRADGSREVVNHYKVSIYYNGEEDYKLFFVPKEKFREDRLRIVSRKIPHPVTPGKRQTVDIFFRFQKSVLDHGRRIIKVHIYTGDNLETAKFLREEEVKLVGPF